MSQFQTIVRNCTENMRNSAVGLSTVIQFSFSTVSLLAVIATHNNVTFDSKELFLVVGNCVLRNKQIWIIKEEELKNAVLVVLCNKQDIPGCLSVADVHRALGLEALRTRTFQIFKTSALKGDGLDEAMEW